MRLPDGVDWLVWRLLTSDKLTVSLDELNRRWTIDDILDAHDTLDALEEAEAKAWKH